MSIICNLVQLQSTAIYKMSTVSHICVSCENIVWPRQEAIECDSCKRWTHRTCGTGISRDDYRRANRENGNIQYTCLECRSTRQPEVSAISDPVIHGCAFYFGQALWKNVQQKGLQPAYNKKDRIYKILRQIFALPFLPSSDIEPAFERLQEKALKVVQQSNSAVSMAIHDFLDYRYVESTWLRGSVWSAESWSVFRRSIRTNNDCEEWHNRINQRARKGNLPFYLTVGLLFQEATRIPTSVKMVSEGKLRRRQMSKSTETGKLMALWEEYVKKEISASRLLKEASKFYAPV